MSNWIINGSRDSRISSDSRALQYGDGLFETIAVRDGKPRLWDYHVRRLRAGCARLGLDTPNFSDIRATIERGALEYGVAKLVVAAAPAERGYARISKRVDVLLKLSKSAPLASADYRDGIEVEICETRLAVGSAVAGLKTLNRLEQVLARNELEGLGVYEGLTLSANGELVCGTMSNLFVVRGDSLLTPRLDNCGVHGVMRQFVMDTMSKQEQPVHEGTVASLDDCDEVFLTNSQFGVLPVSQCGRNRWDIGPITRRVQRSIAAAGVTEPVE